MSLDDAPTAGPRPDEFIGSGAAGLMKRLFHATRPKFFPASLLPVLAGTAWGFMAAGSFDAVVFLLALLATLCVHGGANVLNDVGDDAGGTDRQNTDRIYPYTGGSRFIQAGIMSSGSMARLGISLLTVAAIAGLILLLIKGVLVLWFGVAGVLLAVLYSLGPLRLSSLGLGETAVAFGFGILPVTGAAWLQSGDISPALVIFSLPISAWVAAILLINEVPDIAADGATAKRTLPVRLGHQGTAMLYASMHLFAAAVVAWLSILGPLPIGTLLLPAVLLIPAFQAASAIRIGVNDRHRMTKAIEATLGIHTVGSLWLMAAALFVAFWQS
ncbi:MAG: 1,4-dihydroxy-2-naphthoate octaprenyltransferase [Gammaproteobacteria bacterium]|nr:1,4-dihydroxy-2-naphthoate octaprenyltransferase [Gammaproteobacteria bacterium]MDH5303285.1 1,4-dihydroxy-2-naphthoate octaprenyltransferase [Gammaproteobacteria bacterium]MDH5323346.1 1,4-dihydroxy-2-naphthoate octaprenyltransferase [Gammaproteobacteria bacterium]